MAVACLCLRITLLRGSASGIGVELREHMLRGWTWLSAFYARLATRCV